MSRPIPKVKKEGGAPGVIDWSQFDYAVADAIHFAAQTHGFTDAQIVALVKTESAGDPWAYRVEPHYRYLVDVNTFGPFRSLTQAERASEKAPGDFPHFRFSSRDTEWWGQQASWGIVQIMGAVAREHGFNKPFPMLCSPEVGLRWGLKHLARYRTRFEAEHGMEGVFAAYNAGSPRRTAEGDWENQWYVEKIRANGGLS